MGLRKLEWFEQKNDGWVARIEYANGIHRRYAHVNIYDWAVRHSKDGKIPLQFQFYMQGYDVTWHEDIDTAKLYAEAIFALAEDGTDSLTHWR
jgi:hypothetical protein